MQSIGAGRVFHGRYRVERCLKTGGMGAVYEVVDQKTERRRALKVMLPGLASDRELRERFKREAVITAPIESEHIVETFDADVDEETGSPFLVMELLRGEDLGAMLGRRGPFSAAEVVAILTQIALAIDLAHAAGIVHRDLKPENLFATKRTDGSPRFVVLDFGIAKLFADSTRVAGTTAAVGTPLYMSPEQIRGDGDIGPRSDLYALGHIAFSLLVGSAYWTEEQAARPAVYAILSTVLAGVVEAPSARAARLANVEVPAAFDAWFAKATASEPRARFDRAGAAVTALAEALAVPLRPRDSFAASLFADRAAAPIEANDAPTEIERTHPSAPPARAIAAPPANTSAPVSTGDREMPRRSVTARVGLVVALAAAAVVVAMSVGKRATLTAPNDATSAAPATAPTIDTSGAPAKIDAPAPSASATSSATVHPAASGLTQRPARRKSPASAEPARSSAPPAKTVAPADELIDTR